MLLRLRGQARPDDAFDLVEGAHDGGTDLVAFVVGEPRQQAMRRGRAAADANSQVVGARVIEKALSGNFHRASIGV